MRTSLSISLPQEMKDWIDAKLLAALESGEPVQMTPKWWEERRKELARRIKARKAKA